MKTSPPHALVFLLFATMGCSQTIEDPGSVGRDTEQNWTTFLSADHDSGLKEEDSGYLGTDSGPVDSGWRPLDTGDTGDTPFNDDTGTVDTDSDSGAGDQTQQATPEWPGLSCGCANTRTPNMRLSGTGMLLFVLGLAVRRRR